MNKPKSEKNLSKLCMHTITTKPWILERALDEYCKKGIGGISIWENAVKQMGALKAGELLKTYPIEVVSYVRGGFFAHDSEKKRLQAIDYNKRLIEDAKAIGAPLLVLVCGAEPKQSLEESRSQIMTALEKILPFAQEHQVKLGIEPLHPMYAHSRSAINTLQKANSMAERFNDDYLGVVLDVFHLWWEENMEAEILRTGQYDNLFAYHICDWKMPMNDLLNDRGLMGEGCIDLKKIGSWVKNAGFTGFHEVEIFSNYYWSMDQSKFLDKIIEAYLLHC